MQGKPIITLKQMLAHMASTCTPFALRYVKYNEQKGTGGELVELVGQLLSGRGPGAQLAPAAASLQQEARQPPRARRPPNHYANATRNLVGTANGHFTKVHIYLITEFEGKKVII